MKIQKYHINDEIPEEAVFIATENLQKNDIFYFLVKNNNCIVQDINYLGVFIDNYLQANPSSLTLSKACSTISSMLNVSIEECMQSWRKLKNIIK